jgi:hypothetical protein
MGRAETKKIKKITVLMLKLFFFQKKVAKIKNAEKPFGIPTEKKTLTSAKRKPAYFTNETHKRKS